MKEMWYAYECIPNHRNTSKLNPKIKSGYISIPLPISPDPAIVATWAGRHLKELEET